MMTEWPRLSLVYLMYHSDRFIGRFLEALAQVNYPRERLSVIVVDHPHQEYGSSVPALERELARFPLGTLPSFTLLPQTENRGFPAGINCGIKAALEQEAEFIFLHSHDGFLASDALANLVQALKFAPTIGAAQALMMSYPQTDIINNAGGRYHYAGFGQISENGTTCTPPIAELVAIGYASGGAAMLRSALVRQYGTWDEDYFLYHEDIEYSLRLRSVGYRIVMVPAAVLYHEYEFSRNARKWYFMERNRWGLIGSFYRWPTLVVLAPCLLVIELAVLVVAFRQGWFREKLQAYGYWLQPANLSRWWIKRKKIQLQRTTGDRTLLEAAVADVEGFPGQPKSGLLWVGNYLSRLVLVGLQKIVWW